MRNFILLIIVLTLAFLAVYDYVVKPVMPADPYLQYEHEDREQVMKHFKVHARTFDGDTIVIGEMENYNIDALTEELDWGSPIRPLGFNVTYDESTYIFQLTVTNEHDIYWYEFFGSHNGEDWSDVARVWGKNRLKMTRYTLIY